MTEENSNSTTKTHVFSSNDVNIEIITVLRELFVEHNLILVNSTSASEVFTLEAATTNEEKTLDSHDNPAEVFFKALPSDTAAVPIVVPTQIQLKNELRDFGRTSAARANNEFEIKRYLQIYNELNEDQQKACALANKQMHAVAMRMVEYENRPPLGTRIKETFKEIGTGIHKTFDAWFGKKTIEEIQSDQAKKVLEQAKECAIKQEDTVRFEADTNIVPAPSTLSSSNHFEQPTFDLSNDHNAQIIASIIADPSTSKNVVDLFERTLALQNNNNAKEHADLSGLSINLLVYSHIIEKTLSNKNILLKENEIKHFEKLKATALEVTTNICDYLTILLEEFTNKLTKEHDSLVFLAQHPLESLKMSTQFLGNLGLNALKILIALDPVFDDEFFGYISPHNLDALEESSRKFADIIEQIEKSVVDFTEMSVKEQFRSLTKVTIDLATLHLISKSCSLLQSQLRTNALQLNALESVMLASEDLALLQSTRNMIFKEQQLVNSIEKTAQNNLEIITKIAVQAQQKEISKQAILELSKEFSQSEKGLEIMALLERRSALNFIELHKDLTKIAHLYRKETVLEAMKALELTSEKLQSIGNKEELQKTIKAIQKTTKDIAKLNSNPEWDCLKYTNNNKVTKESIQNALQAIKAKESALAVETIKELQTTQGQTSIWHKIEPTEGIMPETLIPRSFTIDVEGTKLWIHPNATKHFEEFIASPNLMNEFVGSAILPAAQTLQAQELILNDFYATIKELIKDGIPTTERAIELNGWEISIGPSKKPGSHPIIFHAIRNYK